MSPVSQVLKGCNLSLTQGWLDLLLKSRTMSTNFYLIGWVRLCVLCPSALSTRPIDENTTWEQCTRNKITHHLSAGIKNNTVQNAPQHHRSGGRYMNSDFTCSWASKNTPPELDQWVFMNNNLDWLCGPCSCVVHSSQLTHNPFMLKPQISNNLSDGDIPWNHSISLGVGFSHLGVRRHTY